MKKFAYILSILALSGCTTYYEHPTKGESAFNRDQNSCVSQGYASLPVYETSYMTAGSTSSTQTNCQLYGNTANCTSTGGNYSPPTKVVTNNDANGIRRAFFVHRCLLGKGWSETK